MNKLAQAVALAVILTSAADRANALQDSRPTAASTDAHIIVPFAQNRPDLAPSEGTYPAWRWTAAMSESPALLQLAATGTDCTCVEYRYGSPIKVCVRWVKGVCAEYVIEVPKTCVRQHCH